MEWKTVKIGDIGKVVTGKTPRTSIAENYGGNIPFLTPSDDLALKFAPVTNKTLTEQGVREVKNCLIPANSVCVSCIGSDLGKVVMNREPLVTNQQINSILPHENVNAHFIYYAMIEIGKHLNHLSKTSTAVPIINKSTFCNTELRLPPLETQRRIAAILSSLDDKIENNNRINRNLEEQAQALFKSWFVDFEPFGGSVPNDWKEGTLEEICTQLKEKVGNRDDVKVLSPVTTGKLMLSEEYFSKQVFSQSIAKYIVVPPTAFAYNPARVNIGSLGMNEFDFDGCVSPVYVVFECRDGYEYFFDLFRRTNKFKEEVKSRAIGGVRQTLGYDDFKRIQTVIPPKEIVDEFNKIYAAMLDVSDANKRENQRLATLRDTLLPKLMRGEISL